MPSEQQQPAPAPHTPTALSLESVLAQAHAFCKENGIDLAARKAANQTPLTQKEHSVFLSCIIIPLVLWGVNPPPKGAKRALMDTLSQGGVGGNASQFAKLLTSAKGGGAAAGGLAALADD